MMPQKLKSNQLGAGFFLLFVAQCENQHEFALSFGRFVADDCHELEFGNLPRGGEEHEEASPHRLYAEALEGSISCCARSAR